jgi:hypothetical protein
VAEFDWDVSEGLLIAASYSEVTFVRVSCYFFVVLPLLCAGAFGWMLTVRTGVLGRILMRHVAYHG